MKSQILGVVTKGIVPVASVFSIYLLLRGHDAPGGGFVAGLVVNAALVLQSLTAGVRETKLRVQNKIKPSLWIGLSLAALSGLFAVTLGQPYLRHYLLGAISTTLLFDLGVFVVVVGSVSIILNTVAEMK